VNTETPLGCSNRCRDIVIFKLLGCRPPASWISLDLCNGPNSQGPNCVTVPLCQISSKSVKPWPRYGYFSIFKDGGHRHLGFLNFQIFNGRDGQKGQTASSCQISSKSLKPRLRYGDFSIFSGRELAFTFAICYRHSVCLSVVCEVRHYNALAGGRLPISAN